MVGPRNQELQKCKLEKHTIFGPIDHDDIKTHNRKYMTGLAQNKMQIKEINFPGSKFTKSDVHLKMLENDIKDSSTLANRLKEKHKLLNLQRTYASKVFSTNKSDIKKNRLAGRSGSPLDPQSKKAKISALPKIIYDEEEKKKDYQYLQKRNNIGNDYLASLRNNTRDANIILANLTNTTPKKGPISPSNKDAIPHQTNP